MPPPTTAVIFTSSTPAAPPGLQNTVPQSDGAQPFQRESSYMPLAVAGPGGAAGAVKPDGTSITQDPDGTIHAVVTGGSGGGTGGGGASASGGFEVVVVPSGAKDGSNTQYTLPAPVLAGTAPKYVRNGVVQRQLGTKAEFAVQGTTLTTTTPLQPDPNGDWHEFYYVQGTPNSESGGGGGVTPTSGAAFVQGNSNYGLGTSLTSAFPANNTAGNCLIVDAMYQEAFGGAGSMAISDSQGNTWVHAATHEDNGFLVETWYALNCAAGANTVTVTYSGTAPGTHPGMAIAIHEYSGVALVSAFDADNYGFAGSTGTLPIALSLTTTADLDLLHLYASGGNGGGGSPVFSNSASWTQREVQIQTPISIATFDAQAGNAGSYSNSISTTPLNGTQMQGYLLALKSQ